MIKRDLTLYYDGAYRYLYMVFAKKQTAVEEIGLVKHDIMLSQPSSRDDARAKALGMRPASGRSGGGHVAAWWDV